MKTRLTDQERARIDQRIAAAEQQTGTQIVLAVIGRCDSYAELPWKAFALGCSLAGLAAVGLSGPASTPIIATTALLAAGAGAALLTLFAPGFARLFLSADRAATEVHQYAQALFLERELFATDGRRGILLLVSLFEHQVVLVPDRGVRQQLDDERIREIITAMTPLLANRQLSSALEQGLDRLIPLLATTAGDRYTADELSNGIIEEKGV